MLIKNELERMWEEVVVAIFEEICQHLPEGYE
jgi:hypothetical protein